MRQSVVCKTDLMTEINTGFGWNAGRKLTKQWPLKTVRRCNTYIRQSRLQFTLVKQDKEGHFTLMKGEIHQKKIRVINLYAPNVNATNFIKHTLKDWKETNRSVIQAKNQHRNLRTKLYHKSNGTNWCLQYFSSNNSTIYILLSSSCDVLQSRSYLRTWSKLLQI
jgi:hypothetical protein